MTGSVHACAVALDGHGLLIRGPAGAGKSTLARALVAHWTGLGRFARLVADDHVALELRGGRLVARVPHRIEGLVEVHGVGILPVRHLAAVRLTHIVDLVARPERMPEEGAETCVIDGVGLAALCLSQRSTTASVLAVAAVLAADGLTCAPLAPQRPPT
ncbi:aldolase [Acuticoccus sediminis]|uniref:Aldolase n=1 Tax=Acuticoccus sediminis TaxID=2184697 RepID=A0A8B2NYT3_9HYPH|nr:HPr kinase/phosphatase C-terminal domain-containing protein [Acuticoccus sediminis]RAI03880.1 aldolase [Acuticoccus sediminis]